MMLLSEKRLQRIDTKNEEQKEYSETLKRSTEGVSDIDSKLSPPPSFMLPGVESRFQGGGLEGRGMLGEGRREKSVMKEIRRKCYQNFSRLSFYIHEFIFSFLLVFLVLFATLCIKT
jgi:hypothetical protein